MIRKLQILFQPSSLRPANRKALIIIGVCWFTAVGIPSVYAADSQAGDDRELPTYKIPNTPPSGEAYYAPDSLHIIAQVRDEDAVLSEKDTTGTLTYTFTDQGEELTRINDRGQDACSFFFPDQSKVVWTSTRDRMDMPLGDWADERRYPQGAELYSSNLDGSDVFRLTNNEYYDAEVSVSPDGEWILFGRQIDGKMDLWRIRPDGTDERQITFTDEWQEGGAFYLPDSETIIYRAWKRSDWGKIFPTPMTISTIKHDGTETTPRTFDEGMNWAPFPAPDGRHYVFVRVVDGNNWDIFLGDLEGGDPVRLTYQESWDGLPSISPDGTKMLFTRGSGGDDFSTTFVMDISSLNVRPQNRTSQ